MARWHVAEGLVVGKQSVAPGVWQLEVACAGERRLALCYSPPLREPQMHDRVVINTAAVDLALGTGGYDFVMHILEKPGAEGQRSFAAQAADGQRRAETGHMMKLRYTPWQLPVLAIEEPDSPHHATLKHVRDVGGMPAVLIALHSQLAPAAAALRLQLPPKSRIVFVMTDDAALPVAFSFTVPRLRKVALVDGVVTTGHAFGGDVESMTLFSGLLAARHVLKADAVIVGPGPGSAGTGTPYGTPAICIGQHADAVSVLGGEAVVAPRISFSDRRERHRGISHHTLTAFGRIAQRPCTFVLPTLESAAADVVAAQIERAGIDRHHNVVLETRGEDAVKTLADVGIALTSMGRNEVAERPLFLAAAAAGYVAADFV